MSGCLIADEAIPALTSRFLLLMENNDDDLLELKPKQQQVRSSTSRLEESKEPNEAPMMFSPYSNSNSNNGIDHHNHHNNSSPLWSYLPRFDTIPAHNDECGGLPNFPPCPLPPPTPSTPLSSTTKGNAVSLFASFSSSPKSPQEQSTSNMWQYNDEHKAACPSPSFLSPRTTDAVWRSPAGQHRSIIRGSNSSSMHKSSALIPNLPPIAPPLLSNDIPSGSNHQHHTHDGPPSIIRCRTSSSSSSITDGFYGRNSSSGNSNKSKNKIAVFDFDEDEVSVLADDPDEDDAGVFPPSTYDVLVNILDEIDKDESAADGALIEE